MVLLAPFCSTSCPASSAWRSLPASFSRCRAAFAKRRSTLRATPCSANPGGPGSRHRLVRDRFRLRTVRAGRNHLGGEQLRGWPRVSSDGYLHIPPRLWLSRLRTRQVRLESERVGGVETGRIAWVVRL